MSDGTRSKIAEKFARNWQEKNNNDMEEGTVHLDDSLTSLQWLHNITVLDMAPSVAIASESSQASSPCSTTTDDDTASEESHTNMITNGTVKIDYNSDPDRKPPYSYATLICMAMKETNKSKITLSGIYKWIRENFVYYRHADPTWQNSIRHNLSLNKCFVKVARKKDEPGKGGFWKIDPAYADMFVDGVFKRRRNSSKSTRKTTPNKPSRSKSTSSMPLKHGALCTNDVKHFKPDRGSWPYQRHSVSSDYNDMSYLEEEIPPFSNGGNQDLSWNALLADGDIDTALREAIDAQGIIIDHNFRVLNSPFTSPPPPVYYETEVFTPDDNLDLTIRGVGLTPSPRMPPSPPRMQQDHPWAEQPVDDVIASLDFLVSENLENHF